MFCSTSAVGCLVPTSPHFSIFVPYGLTGIQIFTVDCQALKNIPTIHKAPDNLFMIWFQSPTYDLNHSAFLVAIIPMYYVTHAMRPECPASIPVCGTRME